MTRLLAALLIIAAILYGGIIHAQSFDITCEDGVAFATPTASGLRILCATYTPTPTNTHTSSLTPTLSPTPLATAQPSATTTPAPPTATPFSSTATPIAPTATHTPVAPTATSIAANAPVVAFPGAEGWGAASVGGRGGRVIEVTNLADSGTGSLRACIIATGARTCVFKVAGTITLATRLTITSPYITVAGQTAPGGGIAIRNGNNLQAPIGINTHDVIIRHLRLRPGPPVTTSSTVDGLTIFGTSNKVILDHLTISWSADEAINTWDSASDITVQWSFLYNELCNGWHGDGHPHCDSILFGSNSTRLSAHHNLLAHNDQRNPRMTGGDIDFVNNVIYDAGTTPARMFDIAGTGPAKLNLVNNYFKRGPESYYSDVFKCSHDGTRGIGCYVSGNVAVPVAQIASTDSGPYLVTSRYPFPQVRTSSAAIAYADVLDRGGATKPQRDSMDSRIVNEVNSGTGGFIDHPSEVGGWPTLAAGVGYADGDKDGIADAWEVEHGLNANDGTDGSKVSGNGYTNLELFLSELAN